MEASSSNYPVLVGVFVVVCTLVVLCARGSSKKLETETSAQTGKATKRQTKVDITAKRKADREHKQSDADEATSHALLITSLPAHLDHITGMATSLDGQFIATCSRDLRVWKTDSDAKNPAYSRMELKLDPGTACTFSNDSKFLVVALESKRLQFFSVSVKDGRPWLKAVHDFATTHKDTITSVAWGGSGRSSFVLTCCKGEETTVHLWTPKGVLIQSLQINQLSNNTAASSIDGRWSAIGAQLSDVKVWEAVQKDGAVKAAHAMSLKGHKRGILAICFGSSCRSVVTGSLDGSWRLWDIGVRHRDGEEAKLLKSVQTTLAKIECIAFSPHASTPQAVAEASTMRAQTGGADPVVDRRDGNAIAASCGDVILIFSSDGTLLHTIEHAHKGGVRSLAFTGDGQVLASAGSDKHVKLWRWQE